MNAPHVLFMVEGGKALDLVRTHISETKRVRAENKVVAEELGVRLIRQDILSGAIRAVAFPDAVHPEFTKPNKDGRSYPKKGTAWRKRFDAQVGFDSPSSVIANHFDVPLTLGYKTPGGEGWRCIGNMMTECGWMYLSADGPYAMWVPDIPAEVAAEERKGHTVAEPAKSFKLEFEGCRRIESEEWDILVAQHALAEKKVAKAALELAA